MNCAQCRNHFSDYLEKAVTPILEREMGTHFEACQGCATDLRELEVAIARLRKMTAVAAPPGLAASVTSRLLATPLAAAHSEPAMQRSGKRSAREPARTWPWATLAAASLLIAAASFFAGHVVSGGPSGEDLANQKIARRQVESLEKQLSDTRAKFVEASANLRHEVMSLTSGFDHWKIEHAAALESERETRRDLDRRLQETARQVETHAESLAAVRARLDAAVEERNSAITEMDSLTRELALATERRAAETRRRLANAAAWTTTNPRESRAVPPVLFVRNGDIIRLKTRGTLDEIVPHLFTFAESDAEPEFADLALTTLESRLEPFALAVDAEDTVRGLSGRPERAGIVGWFNRRVGLANAAYEEPDDRSTEWSTDRSTRLDRLQRIWQARLPSLARSETQETEA